MATRAPKQKDYNVFLVAERRETAVLYIFDSRDFVQPTLAAKECMLGLTGSGQCEGAQVFTDEKALGKFLRKKDVPLRPGKKRSGRTSNP